MRLDRQKLPTGNEHTVLDVAPNQRAKPHPSLDIERIARGHLTLFQARPAKMFDTSMFVARGQFFKTSIKEVT